MVVHSTKMVTSKISFDLKWGKYDDSPVEFRGIHGYPHRISTYFIIFLVFVTPAGESHIFFSWRAA